MRDRPPGCCAGARTAGGGVRHWTPTSHRRSGYQSAPVDGSFRRYRAHRGALAAVQQGLMAERRRWTPVTGPPTDAVVVTGSAYLATAATDVDCPRDRLFAGFTDGALYSRWLGAPVRIVDGHFAATLEWGTEVRGRYELVCAPDLIVMNWDFGEQVPVPGEEHRGYARFTDTAAGGSQVHIDQLVDTADQAAFMRRAWGFVLGRLATNVNVLLADQPGP